MTSAMVSGVGELDHLSRINAVHIQPGTATNWPALVIVRDARTALGTRIRRWLAFPLGFETAIAGVRRKGRAVTTMHPEPSSLKRMFADYMWEWLTPSFIFALYYAPASIIIIMLAPFQVGSEFVTGFCLGGAITSGCVIISDLHRGYREFKRQSDESDRLNHQWNKT